MNVVEVSEVVSKRQAWCWGIRPMCERDGNGSGICDDNGVE